MRQLVAVVISGAVFPTVAGADGTTLIGGEAFIGYTASGLGNSAPNDKVKSNGVAMKGALHASSDVWSGKIELDYRSIRVSSNNGAIDGDTSFVAGQVVRRFGFGTVRLQYDAWQSTFEDTPADFTLSTQTVGAVGQFHFGNGLFRAHLGASEIDEEDSIGLTNEDATEWSMAYALSVSDRLFASAGIGQFRFDRSPVDEDFTLLSIGAVYRFSDQTSLDVSYTHVREGAPSSDDFGIWTLDYRRNAAFGDVEGTFEAGLRAITFQDTDLYTWTATIGYRTYFGQKQRTSGTERAVNLAASRLSLSSFYRDLDVVIIGR